MPPASSAPSCHWRGCPCKSGAPGPGAGAGTVAQGWCVEGGCGCVQGAVVCRLSGEGANYGAGRDITNRTRACSTTRSTEQHSTTDNTQHTTHISKGAQHGRHHAGTHMHRGEHLGECVNGGRVPGRVDGVVTNELRGPCPHAARPARLQGRVGVVVAPQLGAIRVQQLSGAWRGGT